MMIAVPPEDVQEVVHALAVNLEAGRMDGLCGWLFQRR